ncbi:MAG: MSCRAMM family adhesin SdrC [Lachnospiraceae bacterium]|nr:MSCRAMM family adhesin SdrC [Lachnospiraceae bacterium]
MSNKNDRAFGFIRSLFIGLAVALLVLLGVIGYRLYKSATREIADSDVVYVDDTEAAETGTAASETETAAETDAAQGADDAQNTQTDAESGTDGTQDTQADASSGADSTQDAEADASSGTDDTQSIDADVSSGTDDTQSADAGTSSGTDDTQSADGTQNTNTDASSGADDPQTSDGSSTDDVVVIEGEVVDSVSGTDSSAEESTGVYSTLNAACNFRSEAGYEDADGNDTTICTYSAGTVVEVLEIVGGWTKVKIDGVVGYVGGQFVTDTGTDGE